MAISELEARAAAADHESDELRGELELLQTALDQVCATLGEVERDRDVAVGAQAETKRKLRELHLLLDESRETEAQLHAELEVAQAEAAALRRELMLARTTAEVRGRLLDEIVDARVWRRGKAIRRAERVQNLLARN